MALFTRKPLPGPDAPVVDHLDAIARGHDGAVEALVGALAARTLWVAVRELPEELYGKEVVVTEAVELQLLGSTLPDSGSALLVFTDQEQVHLRAPEAVPVAMDGRSVLERVLAGYDGLVLNPGSRHQALRSEWVRAGL